MPESRFGFIIYLIMLNDERRQKGMFQPAVYILASKPNGTLYVGVTSNLSQRITQHREKQVPGFSNKYETHRLVWYEYHETIISAIETEKKIKRWERQWKIDMIEKVNPNWEDLEI